VRRFLGRSVRRAPTHAADGLRGAGVGSMDVGSIRQLADQKNSARVPVCRLVFGR
jgi:hypothetical protein